MEKRELYNIRLREDGILELRYPDDYHGTLEDAINITEMFKKLSPSKKRPVLVICGKYNTFEPGVREYLSGKEPEAVALADAFVMGSLGLKILGNMYLSINKPLRPTRIFNSEEEALNWLRQFL